MPSLFSRVSQLLRANLNDLIDQAEDPEKMLDQLVRDFSDSIQEATGQVAISVGNLRQEEDDLASAEQAVHDWGEKAKRASRSADEATDPAEQGRLNDLAKIALQKQISYETQVSTLHAKVTADTTMVNSLKAGLQKMQVKLDTLRDKRQELVSRAKMAQAQATVQSAMGAVSAADPTSELSRFEDRIKVQEAKVRGMTELEGESIDSRFASLDEAQQHTEVDERLAALKQKTPA